MRNTQFMKLAIRYLLAIAIIPNLIFPIIIFGCKYPNSWSMYFSIAGLVAFIPMTIYYIPPLLISGGYGFVGQMGAGPENWTGVIIALVFWSSVAFIATKIHMKIAYRKNEENKQVELTP
jgi:hypothetical protein